MTRITTDLVLPQADLQPVDWTTVDDAIFYWATQKLSLEGIWENQNAPQPAYPYLSLLRQGEVDEGGIDETRQRSLDVNGVPAVDPEDAYENEEILYQSIQFAVTIQAHVDFDAGATDPSCDAKRLLGILKRSLYQTSTIRHFKTAGLSIIAPQDVQDLSLVINGDWVSRAALDVTFRTASVMTERVGFIEQVQLESDLLGDQSPLVVDAS